MPGSDAATSGRHPVRVGAAFWVQRTDWPSLRKAVIAAEDAGADDLWIDDHLLSDEGDRDDPKLEGWTTLAAVAAVTSRARLGLLVAANGAATNDDHADGRDDEPERREDHARQARRDHREQPGNHHDGDAEQHERLVRPESAHRIVPIVARSRVLAGALDEHGQCATGGWHMCRRRS